MLKLLNSLAIDFLNLSLYIGCGGGGGGGKKGNGNGGNGGGKKGGNGNNGGGNGNNGGGSGNNGHKREATRTNGGNAQRGNKASFQDEIAKGNIPG